MFQVGYTIKHCLADGFECGGFKLTQVLALGTGNPVYNPIVSPVQLGYGHFKGVFGARLFGTYDFTGVSGVEVAGLSEVLVVSTHDVIPLFTA